MRFIKLFSCQIHSYAHKKWTAKKAADLVDYIKTNYQGKVSGDWDYLIGEIEKIPIKQGDSWTQTDIARLKQYVWSNYTQFGLPVSSWSMVAKQFNRSANSCYCEYYKTTTPEERARKFHRAPLPDRDIGLPNDEVLAYTGILKDAIQRNTGPTRVQWSTVAQEVNRTVFDTLSLTYGLLHHRSNVWQGLSLPVTWLKQPMDVGTLNEMQQFIKEHYKDKQVVNWDIVSLYLGIDARSCVAAYTESVLKRVMPADAAGRRHNVRWTPEEIERLTYAATNKDKYPLWKDIAAYVGNGRTPSSCYSAWRQQQGRNAKWTAEEQHLIDNEIKQSHGKIDWDKLLALLPGKTKTQIYVKADKIRSASNTSKAYQMAESKKQLLFGAVKRYTDTETDWVKVSDEVGISPAACRKAYLKYEQQKATSRWTKPELDRLLNAA
ncbi:hypothetical protein LPJ68_005961, partial [Coemansia sp. RSA 1086]